jgi:hypothetical protein
MPYDELSLNAEARKHARRGGLLRHSIAAPEQSEGGRFVIPSSSVIRISSFPK